MRAKRVSIGVLIGFIAIVIAIFTNLLSLSDGIQILILYGLVLVTAEYARSADNTAKAAVEQAEASKQMVELVRSEQEWAMRPYINLKEEINEESVHTEELDYIRLTLSIGNVGRTPTQNVMVHYRFQSVKPPIINQDGSFMCEDVFTGSSCGCVFELSDEITSRLEKKEQIRFEMKVTYNSVFGKEHQTIYRWWRNAPTGEWVTEHCEWT